MEAGKCSTCIKATENEDGQLTGDFCQYHPCNGCDYDCGTETTPCGVIDGDFDCNLWRDRNVKQ